MGEEKKGKFTWKDSNVALFGSDTDRKVNTCILLVLYERT